MELNLGLPFEQDDVERMASPALPVSSDDSEDQTRFMGDVVESDAAVDDGQPRLFEMPPGWTEHWDGMPAFTQRDAKPDSTINVQFKSEGDRRAFLLLLGEHPSRQKSIWFPQQDYLKQSQLGAQRTQTNSNRYPIYVISKGRWHTPLTIRALTQLGIAHSVVVEPQEQEAYEGVLDASCSSLFTLPFSNLGQGSIPARNWVWDHAISTGAGRHWILDDNMDGFYALNDNLKRKVVDFNPFLPIEEFCDRFQNIAIAGMNYEFFADRRSQQPPFRLNTRVYSCILLKNDLPYPWRGRYNEDTDLSIRALKDGWVTVLFNAWLCKKMPTMTMTGGNTDELYQGDGRLEMAESLRAQHPELVTVTRKWDRWQHHVDYSVFKKNKLIAADNRVTNISERR